MTIPESTPLPAPPDPLGAPPVGAARVATPVPVGARSVRAFAWMLGSSVVAKFAAMASQIALGRILVPDDFGAVAQVVIVTAFLGLPRDAFISQALIRRGDAFRTWANGGFWLALALGLACGLAMFAVAPVAGWYYGNPVVRDLIWLSAFASPLLSLGIVSQASLQARLQFRTLAQLSTATALMIALASVVLARMGWGAFAIVVPTVVLGVARSLALLAIERPPIHRQLDTHHWRPIAADGVLLLSVAAGGTIIGFGDYFILSGMRDAAALGHYYFAFALSTQAISLLAGNLASVLFPSFALLNADPARQLQAFLRAVRLTAVAGVPLCIAQAVVADPLITIVYGEKWADAIRPFQILSVGTVFTLIASASPALRQAQGRLTTFAFEAAAITPLFLVLVFAGSRLGGIVGVAWAVCAFNFICGPIGLRIALGSAPRPWRTIAKLYAPSLAAAIIATLAALGVARGLAGVLGGGSTLFVAVGIILAKGLAFLVAYAAAMSLIAREDLRDLLQRLHLSRPKRDVAGPEAPPS